MELWAPSPKTSTKRDMPAQRGCYSSGQLGNKARNCSNNTTKDNSTKKVSPCTSSDVVKAENRLRKDEKPHVCYSYGGHGHNVCVRLSFVVQGIQESLVSIVAGSHGILVRSDLVRNLTWRNKSQNCMHVCTLYSP